MAQTSSLAWPRRHPALLAAWGAASATCRRPGRSRCLRAKIGSGPGV